MVNKEYKLINKRVKYEEPCDGRLSSTVPREGRVKLPPLTRQLENPNFAFARDLFMFGCWTGISFVDIKNLTEDNVAIISGSPWIVSQRQKTGVPCKIKLIDAAIQII